MAKEPESVRTERVGWRRRSRNVEPPPLAADLDQSRLFGLWLRIRSGLGILSEIIRAKAARTRQSRNPSRPDDREPQ